VAGATGHSIRDWSGVIDRLCDGATSPSRETIAGSTDCRFMAPNGRWSQHACAGAEAQLAALPNGKHGG